MTAFVLHLWHIVAPGGKAGAVSMEGIAASAIASGAEALGPGVRRDDGSSVDVADAVSLTLDFFFARAS